ncbi:MAG: hypothetical protein JSV82_00540 [Planctomycetota bacterium]|nr:MAG: hypothetical protein JSV82_00540 [Planctomycetota bacterium]
MNRRQKIILKDFAIVIIATTIGVAAMINLKDWVNHSEAMRAMEHLGLIVTNYRKEHGCVPPESYIDSIKENLEGHVRLGKLKYRARWFNLDSTPDEILAYTEKHYRSLILGKGFVVLRLDGSVEWMDEHTFDALLSQQQSPLEIEMLRK